MQQKKQLFIIPVILTSESSYLARQTAKTQHNTAKNELIMTMAIEPKLLLNSLSKKDYRYFISFFSPTDSIITTDKRPLSKQLTAHRYWQTAIMIEKNNQLQKINKKKTTTLKNQLNHTKSVSLTTTKLAQVAELAYLTYLYNHHHPSSPETAFSSAQPGTADKAITWLINELTELDNQWWLKSPEFHAVKIGYYRHKRDNGTLSQEEERDYDQLLSSEPGLTGVPQSFFK